jgi:hypothetical protein
MDAEIERRILAIGDRAILVARTGQLDTWDAICSTAKERNAIFNDLVSVAKEIRAAEAIKKMVAANE